MRNKTPAAISFVKAERTLINEKKSPYPFEKLVPDGDAMQIKNRNPESVKSAARTFLKTHPGFHISVEQRKGNVLVFRWKDANRLTLSPQREKTGASKRGRPSNAEKNALNDLLAATAPVNQKLKEVTPTQKPRRAGSGIISDAKIYQMHEEGKTYSQISATLSISEKTIQRAIARVNAAKMIAA